jgi:hypothetical protein
MSTNFRGDRLATSRTFREQIVVRSASTLRARLAEGRRREAIQRLFSKAPRKPGAVYELQRSEPRAPLPDERLIALLEAGIARRDFDEQQLAAYFAELFMICAAQFSLAADVAEPATYGVTVKEVAEAFEAITVAHGVPTRENRETMAREVREAIGVLAIHAQLPAPA